MAVSNAAEVSEIVKGFPGRMGWSICIYPRKAERENDKWVITHSAPIFARYYNPYESHPSPADVRKGLLSTQIRVDALPCK